MYLLHDEPAEKRALGDLEFSPDEHVRAVAKNLEAWEQEWERLGVDSAAATAAVAAENEEEGEK